MSVTTSARTANYLAAGCAAAAAVAAVVMYVRQLEGRKERQRLREKEKLEQSIGTEEPFDSPSVDQRVLRKAECALARRTSRVALVIERVTNNHNHSAILRTAEALGIQHVWLIDPPAENTAGGKNISQKSSSARTNSKRRALWEDDKRLKVQHNMFAKNASKFLTIRQFADANEAIEAARKEGRSLWVTDLSQKVRVRLCVCGCVPRFVSLRLPARFSVNLLLPYSVIPCSRLPAEVQ